MTTPHEAADDEPSKTQQAVNPAAFDTPPAATQQQQRDGIRTTIVGNLAAEPVVGYTPTGNLWVRLNVASHERVRGAGGAWTDSDPTYTETVVFGPRANAAAELKKRDRVEVVGRPQIETFTRRDGSAGAAMKIVATSVTPAPLDSSRETAQPQEGPTSAAHVTIHHNADHTIANGVQKEDAGIRGVLKEAGFQWSAARHSWYLPASMPAEQRGEIAAGVAADIGKRSDATAILTDKPAPGTPAAEAAAAAAMTGQAPVPGASLDANTPTLA